MNGPGERIRTSDLPVSNSNALLLSTTESTPKFKASIESPLVPPSIPVNGHNGYRCVKSELHHKLRQKTFIRRGGEFGLASLYDDALLGNARLA